MWRWVTAMRLRDVVNLMLLVLMSPLVGSDEAVRLIGDNVELTKAGKLLLTMARHYEQSGISYDAYFEFLVQRFSNIVEDWRRMSSEVNLSILVLVMALIMVEALMVMLIGIGIAGLLLLLMPLLLIPIIHLNQPKIYEYDYLKPTVIGLASASVVYVITHNAPYSLIAFSLGFSTLYLPQFLGFLRLMINLEGRITEPILELTWNPNPRVIVGSSTIEREFSRVRDLAYSVGAPYFVTRAARIVDSVVFQLKAMFRDDVIYGVLIPISYIALVEFVEFVNGVLSGSLSAVTVRAPFSYHVPTLALLISAVSTSILSGKVIHSIGLGLSIMFMFIIPTLPIMLH
jgi:hypothetical protein